MCNQTDLYILKLNNIDYRIYCYMCSFWFKQNILLFTVSKLIVLKIV